MKRVLLNLPTLDGHRQIYVRELCDYFLSRDFFVTVATDLNGLHEYHQLENLLDHPRVCFISDTWTDGARLATRLRALAAAARETAADVVFLAAGDRVLGLLSAQIARPWLRIPAKVVGLFVNSTNYVHQVEYLHQTGRIGRVIERAVLAAYRYRPLSLGQPRIFHEVVMPRFSVLDAALALDEVFVTKQGGRHVWLPDIAVWSAEGEEGSSEAEAWEAQVSAFLATQKGRPVVVYIGMPQARRNYQRLLQLTCDVGGCFIHCGSLHDSHGYPQQDSPPRIELISRSAILESGRFYQSFETARVTLSAARCVVLPYIPRHLGSSGVMLQALMAGRPVLVADQGLMAWRVRNFGLGLTFAPGDWRDMRYKFSVLESMPTEFFADAIDRFLAYFTRTQFESAMDFALGLSRVAPRVPPEESGLSQPAPEDRDAQHDGGI